MESWTSGKETRTANEHTQPDRQPVSQSGTEAQDSGRLMGRADRPNDQGGHRLPGVSPSSAGGDSDSESGRFPSRRALGQKLVYRSPWPTLQLRPQFITDIGTLRQIDIVRL